MIFRWTTSIWAWHFVQVAAMFPRAMEERGSVWGRIWWGEWQEAHVAVTIRPF
mgnify:CR=1 FL=1